MITTVLVALALALAGQSPAPHVDFRDRATPYAGPGRDQVEPTGVSEVLVAYFGPSDPDHPDGGDAWRAASMAVAEANAAGGCDGRPFRLAPVWADDPWKAGAGALARRVYRDHVWAIVGGLDGPTAHLAEQIVAKARLPLVCPATGDRSANAANVPWALSVLPGDHLQAPVLAEALAARAGSSGFAVLSAPDHDSRQSCDALLKACRARSLAPRAVAVVAAEPGAAGPVAREAAGSGVGAVVVLADATTSARLVASLRGAGFRGAILGGASFGRRRFLDEAGSAAEGVVFPLLYDPAADPTPFARAFEAEAGHPPDHAAAHTYDSVALTLAAIRRAGLNRVRIGDELRAGAPWRGATGSIAWDSLGGNDRPVVPGVVRDGRATRLLAGGDPVPAPGPIPSPAQADPDQGFPR